MKRYYLVLVRENDNWHMENGFYNKDEAQEEKECLRAHYKAKDIKIVNCPPNQKDIEFTIKTINERV